MCHSSSIPPLADLVAPPVRRGRFWRVAILAAFAVTLLIGVLVATLLIRRPALPGAVDAESWLVFAAFALFIVLTVVLSAASTFLFILPVYLSIGHGTLNLSRLSSAYSGFAARVGGQVEMKPTFFGFAAPRAVLLLHGTTPCALDNFGVGYGKSRRFYTRLTFDLERGVSFRCQIAAQGPFYLGALFGAQDVQLGSHEFDGRFVVRTNSPLRAPEILDGECRRRLLHLNYMCGQFRRIDLGQNISLSVHEWRVVFCTQQLLSRQDHLLAFYESCAALFGHLAPRLT